MSLGSTLDPTNEDALADAAEDEAVPGDNGDSNDEDPVLDAVTRRVHERQAGTEDEEHMQVVDNDANAIPLSLCIHLPPVDWIPKPR